MEIKKIHMYQFGVGITTVGTKTHKALSMQVNYHNLLQVAVISLFISIACALYSNSNSKMILGMHLYLFDIQFINHQASLLVPITFGFTLIQPKIETSLCCLLQHLASIDFAFQVVGQYNSSSKNGLVKARYGLK